MRLIDGGLIWSMKATHGLPLEDIFIKLAKENAIPTWNYFFIAAKQDGCNLDRLVRDISFAIKEAYSDDIAKEICAKLPLMPNYINGNYSPSAASI